MPRNSQFNYAKAGDKFRAGGRELKVKCVAKTIGQWTDKELADLQKICDAVGPQMKDVIEGKAASGGRRAPKDD